MGVVFPSIFNHVIGPIMRGPSSSHTAAAVRIGRLGRILLEEEPQVAEVSFDPEGSLATTYRGQGSAMGFAGGILGMDISDPELIRAEGICKEKLLQLTFHIHPIGAFHPNTYQVRLRGKSGKVVRYTALSTGGGVIKLIELNGEKVEDDRSYVAPLMPVQVVEKPALDFADLQQYQSLLEENDTPLSSSATSWEAALGKLNPEEVENLAMSHLQVMESSVVEGLSGTSYADRILPRQSHLLAEAQAEGRLIEAELTNEIIAAVTAVMETKSGMGLIVAAPTAGSCGTLAGSLWAVGKFLGKGEEKLVKALLAAGLVGVFIAQHGGFAAEEGGCQYECGAASGMTAAALVELMGGGGRIALAASSMALQNTLGLICDPVADRVEVPCLGKNIMAALNALAAANMALAGFTQVIPMDQVIVAMHEVGKNMPSRYRCTCRGGLYITPAAQEIQRRIR